MTKSFFYFLLLLSLGFSGVHVQAGEGSATEKLGFTDAAAEEFLSPERAFQVDFQQQAQGVELHFKVAPGYYLYKQRIKVELTPAQEHTVNLPAGEIKNDPHFGRQEVYHHDFTGTVTLQHLPATALKLKVSYQGCSENGLCYAPQHKIFTLAGSGGDAIVASEGVQDEAQAEKLLSSGHWGWIILGFFAAGLLLSFTPCVFPMIPILSGIIIGKNAHTSRWHAFNLSLAYTLGMCLTYTLAGIAAGFSGQLLSSALQTPWALGFGALVFVLLALSMFGFYDLKLPSGLESSVLNLSHRIKGGRFLGDFLMGVLSALIISPCVAAPLAGALLYISKTHDAVLGGVALFSLSLGMGMPLLMIGASAGTLLPKVGAWMTAVRNLFGVLMLGVAVWLIAPVIPMAVQMALWAILLIVPAIFMHALDSLPMDAKPVLRFWKGVAILMLITGVALLLGALSGAKSPLQPLSGVLTKNVTSSASGLNFNRVRTVAELDSKLQSARGQWVMLDFYADWCVSCKEWEQFTFRDARVQAALKDTLLLQVDVTENSAEDKALLQKFGLFGPPGIIFFDAEGQELPQLRLVGYKNADEFLTHLERRHLCVPNTLKC